jgi:predicted phosphodiesterase
VSLADEIALADPIERKLAEARRERDSARLALKHLEAESAELRSVVNVIRGAEALDPQPPKWMCPTKPKAGNRATLVAFLSDAHFDEVVNPEEVAGINAYNRPIATARLKRFYERTVHLSRHYLAGVTYDGIVHPLGGDLLSGDIHEELKETNEDTILSSLLYWSEQVAAGIGMLADEFGKVHVPVVVGNHGRMSRKPQMKRRAKSNFDWLLGHMIARLFADDQRVTFQIGEEADARFNIYDTRFLLTHGDQFRGGNGIAGIWSPIMKGDTKKRGREQYAGSPFDVMMLGHWHQLKWGGGFIVNGCNKGVDEYAWLSNFEPEPPQQACFVVAPGHGITIQAPLEVADQKREGW